MKYAPVVIPTLCRHEHLARCLDSLMRNPWADKTDVFVALDYPPNDEYREGWVKIKDYVNNTDFSAFASFTMIERSENMGAISNRDALIEYVFQYYDRLILSDDDCEYSPNFLEYMDKCLMEYDGNSDVIAVTGYSYPVKWKLDEDATCFLQDFICSVWGIGFWKTKFEIFAPFIRSGSMLKNVGEVIKTGRHKRMLDSCLTDYIPAASCWNPNRYYYMNQVTDMSLRAYLAIAGKYAVCPTISKSRNWGFDGSGENCGKVDTLTNVYSAANYDYENQPIDNSDSFTLSDCGLSSISYNRDILNEFDFRSEQTMSFSHSLISFIERHGALLAPLAYIYYKLKARFSI